MDSKNIAVSESQFQTGNPMIIAVCSNKDYQQVTGHAGQARRWMIFDADDQSAPRLISKLELDKAQTFHHFKDDSPHPMDDIEVLLASSSGDSFVKRMQRRGVEVVLTAETDPISAVNNYITDKLKPPKSRPIMGMICKVRDLFSEHRE